MNNSSRIGAQGFSHHEARLGNVKLVSRVAMGVVTGVLALVAGGHCAMGATPAAANPSQEIAAAKAREEAARLAQVQPLIAEQMKLGMRAAGRKRWQDVSKAAARILEMDPDHVDAQELKRRAIWGPVPEKIEGNLKYKEHPSDPTCAISGVAVKKAAVPPVLPTQFEGRAVVRIGHEAFSKCQGVKSVTIPSSVTSIGNRAFHGCSRLTSVTIPSSVTSIGNRAFYECGGLTSVTIPSKVTRIGAHAFSNCYSLTSVTIPSGVTRIGRFVFSGCRGLTSVTIPSNVTRIGHGWFSGCKGLTSVTIASGVTSIGRLAFSYCEGLTSVTIQPGVTSIGDKAFSGCRGLTSVTIPSGVTRIGEQAFEGCSGLKSVTLPKGVDIERDAFKDCPWQPTE